MAEGPGHRALVGLFGQHPGAIFSILKMKDDEAKGYTVECGSENLSSSRTADTILKFKDTLGGMGLAVILDTQRRQDHDVKRWTWAQYYYTLHVILKKKHPNCRIRLVVFTIDDNVADWAREPVVHGDHSFAPDVVIGPRDFPRITDVDKAKRDPIIAALSAVMHRRDLGVWQAVLPAIAALAPDDRGVLYNVIMTNIPKKQLEVVKQMSLDFYAHSNDAISQSFRRGMKTRDREIALDLLQTRFGELFTADHRARVEAATARQLQRIIHNIVKPDFTLDDALAQLPTAAKRARKR